MEYVNRESVISKIAKQQDRSMSGVEDVTYYRAIKIIRDEPPADVQPVKHGQWETWGCTFNGTEWKRCSLCGKPADISYAAMIAGEIKMVTSAICGCCGAKMDIVYQDDKIRAIKVV